MKKKLLAFFLGGVVAAGSFLQTSAAVQAEEVVDDLKSEGWKTWANDKSCQGLSDAHIQSSAVTLVNGYLTVTLDVEFPDKPQGADYGFGGKVYVCEEQWQPTANVGQGSTQYYDFYALESDAVAEKFFSECDGGNYSGEGAFTLTFDGLTSGKTFYVYCRVYDTHGWGEKETYGSHWAVCLGSETPTASLGSSSGGSSSASTPAASYAVEEEDPVTTYEEDLTNRVTEAQPGATIVMEQGVTTLPNSIMKELAKRKDVSLKLEFTYEGKEYVIIIPAGKAVDNDIPWYGPLYLAQQYGNRAGTAGSTASGMGTSYEVQSGDCLSRIAAANNMTLQQLLAKNPQIKDPDKIAVGQKINR